MAGGYRTQAVDTSIEVERMLVESWRAMSPSEKLRRVSELSLAVAELAAAGIRTRHPGASDEEIRLRLAARRLGRDLVRRATGRDPGEE